MKRILLIILTGFSICAWGQKDTIFYNENSETIASRKNASSYSVDYPDTADKNRFTTKIFSISGEIWSETSFLTLVKSQKEQDGLERTWYKESGKLKSEAYYIKDKLEGQVKTYWTNGNLKRDDIFKNDELVAGKCYSSQGNDTIYYPYEVKASYQGGITKLYEYLRENLKYPEKARKKGKEGRVLVQFIVEEDGSISNVTIFKSSGNNLLDTEAIRVMSGMEKWNPALLDGEPVQLWFKQPIDFVLQ